MNRFLKWLRVGLKLFVGLTVLGFVVLLGLYLYLEPRLPSIEGLKEVKLQVPLRVYSHNNSLIAEYGEKRRSPKRIDEIPEKLRQAFLAAEDDRFYSHPGVDYQGIIRAVVHLLQTGERGQGGSTITMQLARNFYLSREKTYGRKINEIFLALKIEQELTKDEILELYLNKIYLGNRAYGVAAAARVYYGRNLDQLDLPQIAMIAGLPKAPSRFNPIVNPERAISRRNYVLKRMLELGFITASDMRWAKAQPTTAGYHESPVELSASYVAEMVRYEISQQFGEEAYSRGLNVYTTIEDRFQEAANRSVRDDLLAYDQRHGYRGPEARVKINESITDPEQRVVFYEKSLEGYVTYGGLIPGLVVDTGEQTARVYVAGGRMINLDWAGLSWARPFINVNSRGPEPQKTEDIIKPGDIVRVYRNDEGIWTLGRVPAVQGALVSLVPNDGAITSLVGGFDFQHSKFNRAIQAKRQAGSSFKPFIYTSALEKNYTAASMINDAPVVFHDPALEGTWRPENYSGKFYGPTRLREALVKSRNLVSIRLLRNIGIRYATDFVSRFGFNSDSLPHDLSLALGSGEVSPLELARGFAVFANGGYLIKPYFIDRIEDLDGRVLFAADPAVACVPCVLKARPQIAKNVEPLKPKSETIQQAEDADQIAATELTGGTRPEPQASTANPDETALVEEEAIESGLPKQAKRVVDERVVYIMDSILGDVINRGTGRRARVLGRNDLHGKTGTTNDQKDAWFNGFNASIVTTAWVGYDQQQKPLGNLETGSRAALPMWIQFMRTALKGVPEVQMPRPENIVTVKINPENGELAGANDKNAIFEIFRAELTPRDKSTDSPAGENKGVIPEQLF